MIHNKQTLSDPEVIIKIDISNAINTTCRALTLDVLTPRTLTGTDRFTYLRYFDWDGQVHLVKGKTDGQQGDPLEMFGQC